jgi:hypothetical protein
MSYDFGYRATLHNPEETGSQYAVRIKQISSFYFMFCSPFTDFQTSVYTQSAFPVSISQTAVFHNGFNVCFTYIEVSVASMLRTLTTQCSVTLSPFIQNFHTVSVRSPLGIPQLIQQYHFLFSKPQKITSNDKGFLERTTDTIDATNNSSIEEYLLSSVEMESVCSFETSVDFQWVTQCYIPEDSTLHSQLTT